MPKAVVIATVRRDTETSAQPLVAWEDTIIYEAHVKGLTQLRQDIPAELRGTFGGLCAPAMIEHLRRLGVTTIELLPVHTFVDEPFLTTRGLSNFWGYNTLSFFTADQRYGTLDRFRETVARLHDAGIEVILDVVYNHTAEGDQLGRTLSFRGIDNKSYYWLKHDEPRFYENFTGCGNALNLSHPMVLRMVVESLRHWVESCDVDGFRFDLATTLARGPHGFEGHSPFFQAIWSDPVLAKVKLIAEPWDIGPGGYRVGAFPPEWSEWNDAFRRTLRRYWAGEGDLIGEMATRMTGSADIFEHHRRTPRASINHVTVHDGFTLADLVSYERKHNDANREDNRDGSEFNISTNGGVEGPTGDAGIVAMRQQLRRNFLSVAAAGARRAAHSRRRRSRQQPGRQQQRLLPGQRDRLGRLVRPRPRRRGHDRAHRAAHAVAQAISRNCEDEAGSSVSASDGRYDVRWLTPEATEMTDQDWSFPNGRFLSYVLSADESSRPLRLSRAQCRAGSDCIHAAGRVGHQPLDERARYVVQRTDA